MLIAIALVLAAYLLGSVPFGYLLCRVKGFDVREHGSGNIGATNVARTLGGAWGALVLLLDLLKGLVPVLAVAHLLGQRPDGSVWLAATMVAAVAGHVCSAFLRLRGGKGVATALGAVLAACPLAAGLGLVVYAALYLLTRISSVGSLSGTATTVLALWLLRQPLAICSAATLIMLLIVVRHHENLRRLLRRQERGP